MLEEDLGRFRGCNVARPKAVQLLRDGGEVPLPSSSFTHCGWAREGGVPAEGTEALGDSGPRQWMAL